MVLTAPLAFGLLLGCTGPRRFGAIWRGVSRDAGGDPSPNGGVIEAAVAGALNVQLGGRNRYGDIIDDRGTLGDGRRPRASDIHRAARLDRHVTMLSAAAASLLPAVATSARRRPPRDP